jgi:hypothetical protein
MINALAQASAILMASTAAQRKTSIAIRRSRVASSVIQVTVAHDSLVLQEF